MAAAIVPRARPLRLGTVRSRKDLDSYLAPGNCLLRYDHGGRIGRTCFYHGDRHYSHGRGYVGRGKGRRDFVDGSHAVNAATFCNETTMALIGNADALLGRQPDLPRILPFELRISAVKVHLTLIGPRSNSADGFCFIKFSRRQRRIVLINSVFSVASCSRGRFLP